MEMKKNIIGYNQTFQLDPTTTRETQKQDISVQRVIVEAPLFTGLVLGVFAHHRVLQLLGFIGTSIDRRSQWEQTSGAGNDETM